MLFFGKDLNLYGSIQFSHNVPWKDSIVGSIFTVLVNQQNLVHLWMNEWMLFYGASTALVI